MTHIKRATAICAAVLIGITAVVATIGPYGCAGVTLPAVLSAADAVGKGLLDVLNWCGSHGATPAQVDAIGQQIAQGNFTDALIAIDSIVNADMAKGQIPDVEVQETLKLLEQVLAVQGVQDGMRALSGGVPADAGMDH